MHILTKSILVALCGHVWTTNVYAADNLKNDNLDASDLTRAYTTFYLGAGNKGNVKASGSLSYQYENGMESMLSLEGTLDKEGKYADSRLQYFHVFNTGNTISPRIAVSLDVIDNEIATTAALGAISIFRTPIDSLTLFARVGAITGQYSESATNMFSVTDDSLVGGMGAGYAVWKTGQDGTFLAVYPEMTYLNGDIESNTVKTTVMAATPLSADKTRWGQVKFENTSGDMESNSKKLKINENQIWFNYKVYL